jgi:hypothetical protein
MTNQIHNVSNDKIIDAMVELARCSTDHRIVLAGCKEPYGIVELHRRGYCHVATTATCKLSRGQYDVAFVEWRRHSIKALEATLDWLVHFLSPKGVLVIWIDAAPGARKLRSAIERLGFRADIGTRCENGFAISPRRIDVSRQTMAAWGEWRFAWKLRGRRVSRKQHAHI